MPSGYHVIEDARQFVGGGGDGLGGTQFGVHPAIEAPEKRLAAMDRESDKSLEWLERAYQKRDPGPTEINSDPVFKNIRRDARYNELLKKMRLPI